MINSVHCMRLRMYLIRYIINVCLPVHKLCLYFAKFEILRAVFIKIKIFCDVETCRLANR